MDKQEQQVPIEELLACKERLIEQLNNCKNPKVRQRLKAWIEQVEGKIQGNKKVA